MASSIFQYRKKIHIIKKWIWFSVHKCKNVHVLLFSQEFLFNPKRTLWSTFLIDVHALHRNSIIQEAEKS